MEIINFKKCLFYVTEKEIDQYPKDDVGDDVGDENSDEGFCLVQDFFTPCCIQTGECEKCKEFFLDEQKKVYPKD